MLITVIGKKNTTPPSVIEDLFEGISLKGVFALLPLFLSIPSSNDNCL
jgi:hypothetical protein